MRMNSQQSILICEMKKSAAGDSPACWVSLDCPGQAKFSNISKHNAITTTNGFTIWSNKQKSFGEIAERMAENTWSRRSAGGLLFRMRMVYSELLETAIPVAAVSRQSPDRKSRTRRELFCPEASILSTRQRSGARTTAPGKVARFVVSSRIRVHILAKAKPGLFLGQNG